MAIAMPLILLLGVACKDSRSQEKKTSKDDSPTTVPTAAAIPPVRPIIVIDPGHGGGAKVGRSSANNATGPTGTLEKNLTLIIAVKVAEILNREGYTVTLTRNSDVNLDLKDRAKVASNLGADVFLSIHLNGNTSASVQGTETWVQSTSTADSRLLASSVQARLVNATRLKNRGLFDRGLGVLSLAVHSPKTAACLSEISFLTNATEETRLNTRQYQDELAQAYAQAIIDYIKRSTSIVVLPTTRNGDPAGLDDL